MFQIPFFALNFLPTHGTGFFRADGSIFSATACRALPKKYSHYWFLQSSRLVHGRATRTQWGTGPSIVDHP